MRQIAVIINLKTQKHRPKKEKMRWGMNPYIAAQIFNIQSMAKVFVQSCEMAALKDDGKISREEAKQLNKIRTATEKFCKELEKIK